MLFFFGPSLGPPAFASALPRQASGPRLGPQKSIFSAHFSMAAILILETQNIYYSKTCLKVPQEGSFRCNVVLNDYFWA